MTRARSVLTTATPGRCWSWVSLSLMPVWGVPYNVQVCPDNRDRVNHTSTRDFAVLSGPELALRTATMRLLVLALCLTACAGDVSQSGGDDDQPPDVSKTAVFLTPPQHLTR